MHSEGPNPRSLLGIEGVPRPEIEQLLERGRHYKAVPPNKKLATLAGRSIVNLFFEPSTRTRTSFEIAAKRLGADTIGIQALGTSLSKGESLVDTLNTLAAMNPDIIVMRHAASGAPHFLSRFLSIPMINAGDGRHEHPTQALLDALTILEVKGPLERLRVAIIGDISHSRVARSNLHLLSKFGADIIACGPATTVSKNLPLLAPGVGLTYDMREAVRDADVIMMLRVQLERQNVEVFQERVLPVLRLDARAHGAGEARRYRAAPGPDQPGARDLQRGRRLPALDDPEPGRERRCHPDGGVGMGLPRIGRKSGCACC